jgi:hypothetical protein
MVLLDKWVMEGKGFLIQNSNLFPQKIGKTFNGCPLRGMVREYTNFVIYEPTSPDKVSSTPVIKGGWDVRLFTIITNSLNMTPTYVRPPNSYKTADLFDVVDNLTRDEADIVFGGLDLEQDGRGKKM